MTERTFTLAEARALMPGVRKRMEEIIPLRADLAELQAALRAGRDSRLGGVPEVKALEARLHEAVSWLTAEGIQVKGMAPLLLDFPSRLRGESVLLCWLEGEPGLDWYHDPQLGFMGRRRIPA